MNVFQKKPRIVFIGTPDFAVASLQALVENNFEVVAVITTPDKPTGRGRHLTASPVKLYAQSKNLPILQPERLKNRDFLEQLSSYSADLQVVVAFRMLPKEVWNMPPMGTINVHASLLPDYRGSAPINRAIMDGAELTGVTTFKLQHRIDTGNILLQKKVPILPEDNAGTMYEKLKYVGASLLIETINGMVTGQIEEKEQDFGGNYPQAPKIFKEDCLINWNNKTIDIYHQIRGLSPIPSSFTILIEKQLKIISASYQEVQHSQLPGSVDSDGKTYLRFATQDGWIYCEEVKFEGKKQMKILEFLRGFRWK